MAWLIALNVLLMKKEFQLYIELGGSLCWVV